MATTRSAPSSVAPVGPLRRTRSRTFKAMFSNRWVESPDGVPAVGDDAAVVGAAAAVEQQAAHWDKQHPVWTHNGHRGPV